MPRVLPPIDGSITLPEALAFHERHNADVPMYVFQEDCQPDITELSYRQFAQLCYQIPRALDLHRDSTEVECPVVAIIALTDTIIYQAAVVGLMHAGFIPFPISPRNTIEAIVNLILKTDCHQILATCCSLKATLDKISDELYKVEPAYKLVLAEMPLISQLVLDRRTSGMSIPKPGLDRVALYLHSSGSTGLPKAIAKTHRELVEFVAFPTPINLRDRTPLARLATMHLPPFHALGLHNHVFLPLLACITVALYPPHVMRAGMMPILPTPDNILEHSRRTGCNVMVTIPSLLQIWVQDSKYLRILGNMTEVRFSGGALSPRIGNLLKDRGVRLSTTYGGTEFGGPSASSYRAGDENDWEYVEFTDRSKVRWVPHGHGLYECQFLICDTHHISVVNLPDIQGYATSDLFLRHPTKDYLWKIVGRIDDVIIHSSGEKTVPLPMENILYNNSHIVGAIMFGHAHSQPGVLIEPAHHVDIDNSEEVAKFRDLVWPTVEEANKAAPAFSRIFKESILIANPKKPFARAGKGTVMRKATLALYAEEIEALYATLEEFTVADDKVGPLRIWKLEQIKRWILDQATAISPDTVISTSDNLFEHGFDSLSATILRRRITSALLAVKPDVSKSAFRAIDQNIVYAFPTIDTLSKRLVDIFSNPNVAAEYDHVNAIEKMINAYKFHRTSSNSAENVGNDTAIVLLTGSTGHLGCHILASLLGDPRISSVYTLSRHHAEGLSVQNRQRERFADEGLSEHILTSTKLVQLEGNCEQKNLGLSYDDYANLLARVTVVIHASWKLDFNQPLSSFEPNIKQTHNLIHFARSSACGFCVRFMFTSSIGVSQGWSRENGTYPEEIVSDAKYAVGMGYGESKYVTERILQTSGLNSISLRIGQITGSPSNGSWATSDWVPIMIKSSVSMGAFPSVAGRVSWISVAMVADIIHTLIFSPDSYPSALNILCPVGTPWDSIMRYCNDALHKERQLTFPLLPFNDWFALLHQKSDSLKREDAVNIPAIKLYDFFKQMMIDGLYRQHSPQVSLPEPKMFSVGKMAPIGKILHSLSDFSGDEVERWISYWIRVGYLNLD